MKLRRHRFATGLVAAAVALFTFGVSSASAGTHVFRFFGAAGTDANIIHVTGMTAHASCENVAANLSAFVVATRNNGILKVDGVDEGGNAFNNQNDDFDTGSIDNLLNDSVNSEVGAQFDYMGAGGSPILSASYASEDGGGLDVGADCAVWGIATTP